jgi:hypothetical protein
VDAIADPRRQAAALSAAVTAVNALSEDQARGLLAAARSQAASPELYAARRCEGGWVFTWRSKERPIPMGVRAMVVTDNGVVGRTRLGEDSAAAIRRLNGVTTPDTLGVWRPAPTPRP